MFLKSPTCAAQDYYGVCVIIVTMEESKVSRWEKAKTILGSLCCNYGMYQLLKDKEMQKAKN